MQHLRNSHVFLPVSGRLAEAAAPLGKAFPNPAARTRGERLRKGSSRQLVHGLCSFSRESWGRARFWENDFPSSQFRTRRRRDATNGDRNGRRRRSEKARLVSAARG